MKYLLVALLFLTVRSESQESKEWIFITKNNTGDKYYVKTDYTRKVGSVIDIWTVVLIDKLDFSDKIYKNAKMKALYSFNCLANKCAALALVFYDSTGEIIAYNDYTDNIEWDAIPPDTPQQKIINKVCSIFNN